MAEEKKHHKKIKTVIEEVVDTPHSTLIEQPVSEVQAQNTELSPENLATTEQSLVEPHIDHPVHTYPTNDESVEVPEEPEIKPKTSESEGFHIGFGFIFITLAVACFVAILSGALYVYFNGVQSLKMVGASPTPSPIVSATAVPVSSATATPAATPVGLDSYKVSVLNGNGKAGVASAGQKVMEDAGFSVIRAANAANFNFANTVIQVKASVPATVVAQATQALEKSYTVEIGTKLEENNAYDIIVTIGAK